MKKYSFKKNQTFLLVTIILLSILITGCSFSRQVIATLGSTDHFAKYQDDQRILFEPGAKKYAKIIASFLPSAIQQIEEKQYRPFVKPIQVYICSSRDSMIKLTGLDARAYVLTKIFISPRVFENGDKIAMSYLIHELSHLHLLQQLGSYKFSRLPSWFKEGLATYVSRGGGANGITETQAIKFIQDGKYFVPNKTGGFIFQKTAGDFNLKPHMFYRQSMMFVSYLVTIDNFKFKKFLLSIEDGEKFITSFQTAYTNNPEGVFRLFVNNINKMG